MSLGWGARWALSKNCAKWKYSIPIYVECDKMYRSKVWIPEFSYFVSGLDIQLEKSECDSPVRKKIGCRWRYTTSHIPFFSRNWYEPMAQWLRLVAESRATLAQFLKSAETLATPRPFCVALSPSVHWHAGFLYFCALYDFFFLGFRQWRSHADRVVNLNTTIWIPLFSSWRTWTRTQHSPTCAGLAHA